MLTTLPSWDGLHPTIVHFPIALLLVVPLFVVLSLAMKAQAKMFAISALIMMVLGTVALFVAASTGEAASERAEHRPGTERALEQHEELAETTQVVFVVLTSIYATLVGALLFARHRLDGWPRSVIHVAFLIIYSSGCAVLVKTGARGGRLVPEYGVHASLTPSSANASAHERDDDNTKR